jgi:hypothetical protein
MCVVYLRDQIVPVLVLLQSTESHLCAGNVLLWVLEVFELEISASIPAKSLPIPITHQCIVVPLNSLGLVGIGV